MSDRSAQDTIDTLRPDVPTGRASDLVDVDKMSHEGHRQQQQADETLRRLNDQPPRLGPGSR